MPSSRHALTTLAAVLGLALILVNSVVWVIRTTGAEDDVRYVAISGMDSESCNVRTHPCRTVQYAVDHANPGDTVKVATGIYTDVTARAGVTQAVYIAKTITIRGGYTTADWFTPDPSANPTTLDAQGQGRVLYLTGNVTATVEGLRITGGRTDLDGGGVYLKNSHLIMGNNQVFSNASLDTTGDYGNGGGLYLFGGNVTLSGNVISTNTAPASGGGVHLSNCNATLTGNTIQANTGDGGGGVFLDHSSAMLSGNMISDNSGSSGGGVYLAGGNVTLRGNVIRSNGAGYGGGVFASQPDLTLINNAVTDNHASVGGGLSLFGSTSRLLHNTIARNTGEGIYVAGFYSSIWLTNTVIVSHTAGLSVDSSNTAYLDGVLWFGNGANTYGAGVISVTHAYTGNPAFAPDGFHLTAHSAAIDRGTGAGVDNDMDDQPRPMGAAPDLGADESVAATGVSIAGPTRGFLYLSYRFTTTITPLTATSPITYTWSPEPASGQGTAEATYVWTLNGPKTITVTAANSAVVSDTHTITITAAPGPVVINEVLYDPVGSDDAGEVIELYNRDSSPVNLTGYDLRAGTAGYYTFPSFTLDPGAFVAIHVNVSGTNTYNHLYTGPMGGDVSNSAASVALFSSTLHSAGTLVDFVQYGAGGQTWESAAQEAGLWMAGDYVPAVAEGSSINLWPDGDDNNTSGDWQACYPSAASSNCSITPTPTPTRTRAPDSIHLPVVVRDWPPTPTPSPTPTPRPIAGRDTCPGEVLDATWDYVQQSFERENDNDWFAFDAAAGVTYRIETGDLGPRADTTLELHDIGCGALLAQHDDIHYPDNLASLILWTAPATGRYHVNVRPYNWTVYGSGTNYTLLIRRE